MNVKMKSMIEELADELAIFVMYIEDRCAKAKDTGPMNDVRALLTLLSDHPDAAAALAVFCHLLPHIKVAAVLHKEFGLPPAQSQSPVSAQEARAAFDALMAKMKAGGV